MNQSLLIAFANNHSIWPKNITKISTINLQFCFYYKLHTLVQILNSRQSTNHQAYSLLTIINHLPYIN